MKNEKIKKALEIGSNILLYLFLAICIFSLGLTIFAKKDADGTAEVFGYQFRIVITESMAKCDETDVSDYDIKSIPLRSMVFVETVPEDAEEAKAWYDELEVGDVLTFKYVYATQVTITHRIISIEPDGDGYIIKLAGDNKASTDNQGTQIINTNEAAYSPNYIVGKVVGQAKLLGFILSIMKEPVGLICLIIIPCAIVIILEIIKITEALAAEKKKKADEENKKKDDELLELRRKLAELEKAKEALQAEEPKVEEPKAEEPEVIEEAAEEAVTEEVAAETATEDAPENDGAEEVPTEAEKSAEESAEAIEETAEEAEATEESAPEEAEAATEVPEEAVPEAAEEAETEATEDVAEAEPEAEAGETSLSEEN